MAIVFKPETHSYVSIDPNENISWTSVTSVISKFKKPFDETFVCINIVSSFSDFSFSWKTLLKDLYLFFKLLSWVIFLFNSAHDIITSPLLNILFWFFSAYVVLPRLNRLLARFYVPDY